MEKLKEKYLDLMNKMIEEYKDDQEILHSSFDGLMMDLLEELGYKEIKDLFMETDKKIGFWYA